MGIAFSTASSQSHTLPASSTTLNTLGPALQAPHGGAPAVAVAEAVVLAAQAIEVNPLVLFATTTIDKFRAL